MSSLFPGTSVVDPILTPYGLKFSCSSWPQGTPKLIRTNDCDFVFEWETPIVCPDEVKTQGCAVTDEQLLYSFNLTSLSTSTFKARLSPWGSVTVRQTVKFYDTHG